jgi:hypothetical protein
MRKKQSDFMPTNWVTPKELFLVLISLAADHAPLSTYLLYPIPIRFSIRVEMILLVVVVAWMVISNRKK